MVIDCYGWENAQAYLTGPIMSDEEDEKRLEKARKGVIAGKLENQNLSGGKPKRKDVPSATKQSFLGSSDRGGLPTTTVNMGWTLLAVWKTRALLPQLSCHHTIQVLHRA